jgi:ABC-type polysaccharide/polyol phosphate export permease
VLPWNFFSTAVMGGINSIVGNAHLIKKVYFPWEALPLSTVLANLVNFLLSLLVLFVFILFYRIGFTPWLLAYLPLIVLVQVMFILGLSMILATLNVYYRDTAVIMEVLLLAWFFLTHIFYPIDILPKHYSIFGMGWDIHRLTYILNPMASVIAAYRDILYGSIAGGPPGPPALDFLGRTAITSVGVLAVGYSVFCRYSKSFAEEV